MELHDRIKYLRKEELKLSQEEFGKILGVNRDVINNIEGNRLKRPEQKEPLYKLICEKFNVNEQWLRTGEGEPYVFPSSDDYTDIVAKIDVKDPKARQAIIDYWNLTESDKELFWNFIDRFIKKGEP